MGASCYLIYKYTAILLKEISVTSHDWIASQKQNSLVLIGFLGPIVLALPIFSYEAFLSLDKKIVAIVNLIFALVVSKSTTLFYDSANKIVHSGIILSQPINTKELWLTRCLYFAFSNFAFLASIFISLIIGLTIFDDIENFPIVVLRMSTYAVTMCCASYYVSYFRLSFLNSIILLFMVGYGCTFIGPVSALLVVTIGTLAKHITPRLQQRQLIKKPTLLLSIIIKSSFATWSFVFLLSLVTISISEASTPIIFLIASACLTILLCQCISWAVHFYQENRDFIQHLPFGKKVIRSTLWQFAGLNIIVQLSFCSALFLMSSKNTALLTYQLLSMFIGVIFAIFNDKLRLASQASILLIYLMTNY